jgi:hypothetical protein
LHGRRRTQRCTGRRPPRSFSQSYTSRVRPAPVSVDRKPADMTRQNKILATIAVLCSVAFGGLSAYRIYRSGFWKGPDAMFGDQHLKTSVALVELHRTRTGKYPETLDDLEFVGEWDRLALNSVTYQVNADHTKYCIEVQRGWVAKPRLDMPPSFWQGTGYDPSVCR